MRPRRRRNAIDERWETWQRLSWKLTAPWIGGARRLQKSCASSTSIWIPTGRRTQTRGKYPNDRTPIRKTRSCGPPSNHGSNARLATTHSSMQQMASPMDSGGGGDGGALWVKKFCGGSSRHRCEVLLHQFDLGARSATERFWVVIGEVVLDRPDTLWMDKLWPALKRGRREDVKLIPVGTVRVCH